MERVIPVDEPTDPVTEGMHCPLPGVVNAYLFCVPGEASELQDAVLYRTQRKAATESYGMAQPSGGPRSAIISAAVFSFNAIVAMMS